MKTVRWVNVIGMCLVALGLMRPSGSFALSGPPPLTDVQIGAWDFANTNWLTVDGNPPISFTNLANPSDWDGKALQINSPHPAWLQYNIAEDDGATNLAFTQGTIEFWFLPDWNSGVGPGDSGRFIDVGAYSTNHPSSWWSLYLSTGGTNIYFSSETNGIFTNYLSVPISWASNNWHLIDLAYSSSGSQLYLDGRLLTNGAGSVYQPSLSASTNGFFVGSDITGTQQMRGEMAYLATYDYPLSTNEVTYDYQEATNNGDDGGGTHYDNPAPNYGTNLWLAVSSLANNAIPLLLSNTQPDVLLEIQGCTNLTEGNWFSEGFVDGSELTNWTSANFPVSQQGNLFLRIRSWVDSTGTGIPDWWWLAYFGQITNVNAYTSAENDGLSNLQKFQMGLNPTNYYNPNPPGGFFGYLNPSGTNAFIAWSPSPGPVLNYAVQRGIQGTNGNYTYTQIGLVSSNATVFEDVGAITNANAQNNIYTLTAVYPGGIYSGTDTWQVSSYTEYGSYGPPSAPPLPGSPYAYVDATGTNILVSWTSAQGPTTNYMIEHGIFNPTNYDFNYYTIGQTGTNTTLFEAVGALTNVNNWLDDYGVFAVYPGGGLSSLASSYYSDPNFVGIHVGSQSGPVAPTNFYGYADATGTNYFLIWHSSPGTVTNYVLWGGYLNTNLDILVYNIIGKTNASSTNFEAVGATKYTMFAVTALFTNNSLSQAAFWNSANGAPAPSALYAWLNSTGTNVQLSWSAAAGAVTGYLVQRSDYGGTYSQVGEANATTTTLVNTNAVNNGSFSLGYTVYEVQAMYPNGGLSPAVTAMVSNTPSAPSNLYATVDSTGTNVSLTWSPALGTVTNYIILRGTYNPTNASYSYSQIGTVSGSTTSFENVGAASGGKNDNYIYELEAAFAGDSLSQPDSASFDAVPPANYNISVTAQLVRNSTGRWQLMFSAIPTNVTTLQLYIAPYGADIVGESTNDILSNFSSQDLVDTLSVSNLNNGCFIIPDSITTNEIGDNYAERVAGVQPVGTGARVGQMAFAGFLPYDAPCFVNGQQHLKQNLLFELRAATITQPVGLEEYKVWFYGDYVNVPIPSSTNYVESSFFHWAVMYKADLSSPSYTEKDDLWPFTVNYFLNTFLYNTNYTGPSSFVWQTNLATIPAAAVLGISDPYWIAQPNALLYNDPITGLLIPPSDFYGDLGAYTNSGKLYLQSGVDNLFGLTFATALVNQVPIATVAPGGSTALTNVNCFFSQTADPSLTSAGYYFAPVNTPGTALTADASPNQLSPIPCLPGFSSTNQTSLMVASVGNSVVIGGWNKYAVAGSSKYGYLGQYYVTNAFVVTNGVVTTNTTGVVSPYGDFFPTQAGQVALVTTPDINTGQHGTGVVDVISLNVDANHDGTMNLTFGGPDFVSPSNPFRFWVNDDTDAGDYGGNGGIPGQGAQGDGQCPSAYYPDNNGYFQPLYRVHGTRDLVDFFPVYLNIGSLFQSNALSAGISLTDTNYQFVLSQANGVLRFAYTGLTPTNYMNYLRNTNEAVSLANPLTGPFLTTITNTGVVLTNTFVASIATNNGGIILVEAAAPTTQPLVLTIYHGTNQIAQTSLPLSISGVEQMFRSKTIMLNSEAGTVPDRLTDASVPNEPNTTGVNFIFVHGYNVSPQQARGWDADYYKRLYWSGSHAKFYGVTWEAADSQIAGQVTINLQTNIVNAFNTAPLLNSFLNSLSGTNVVAAHSLGNMLMLSTLNDYSNQNVNTYFMVDAAVAIEAIDTGASLNSDMYPTNWTNYESSLWASKWHNLFPTNDARSTLTWSGRLTNFQNTAVYNFYSSGEEVLRDYLGNPPTGLLEIASSQFVSLMEGETGEYTWDWQEKLKGLMPANGLLSSDHGGWQFNTAYETNVVGTWLPMSPSAAAELPNSELQTNAFFNWGSASATVSFTNDLALESSGGSSYANVNRNRILSDAIPCLTLPVGANQVPRLSTPESPVQLNFDMQSLYENGWPLGRGPAQYPAGTTAAGEWHHSDNRAVAYTFTYELFSQMVTFGNLN